MTLESFELFLQWRDEETADLLAALEYFIDGELIEEKGQLQMDEGLTFFSEEVDEEEHFLFIGGDGFDVFSYFLFEGGVGFFEEISAPREDTLLVFLL